MPSEISGVTALVTGASRGFGRATAIALVKAGAEVVGVARDRTALEDLRAELGPGFTPVVADAADPVVAGQHAFHWTREALLRPLDQGSVVIAMSSGAAVHGSPLSGGYAGAKAAIRFLTRHAAAESERAGLGIRFIAILPQLTPATDLGSAAVAAYAARQGVDVATFLEKAGPHAAGSGRTHTDRSDEKKLKSCSHQNGPW